MGVDFLPTGWFYTGGQLAAWVDCDALVALGGITSSTSILCRRVKEKKSCPPGTDLYTDVWTQPCRMVLGGRYKKNLKTCSTCFVLNDFNTSTVSPSYTSSAGGN